MIPRLKTLYDSPPQWFEPRHHPIIIDILAIDAQAVLDKVIKQGKEWNDLTAPDAQLLSFMTDWLWPALDWEDIDTMITLHNAMRDKSGEADGERRCYIHELDYYQSLFGDLLEKLENEIDDVVLDPELQKNKLIEIGRRLYQLSPIFNEVWVTACVCGFDCPSMADMWWTFKEAPAQSPAQSPASTL